MDVHIEDCTVTEGQINVVVKFAATLRELANQSNETYKYDGVLRQIKDTICQKVAEEFMAAHKMEIVNLISKDEVKDGIQLKLIEQFQLRS